MTSGQGDLESLTGSLGGHGGMGAPQQQQKHADFHGVSSMAISGTDWLEVPTIYKAYFLGLNFRGYTLKIWPNIWYFNVPPF